MPLLLHYFINSIQIYHLLCPLAGQALTFFILACSVSAIIIGFFGLSTWRKQLKGSSDYKLAKELGTALVHVSYAFNALRNPVYKDIKNPQTENDENPQNKKNEILKSLIDMMQSRWDIMQEGWNKLSNKYFEVNFLWNDADLKDLFIKLHDKKDRLYHELNKYLNGEKYDNKIVESPRAKPGYIEDSFGIELEKIIERIKKILRERNL